MPELPRFTRLCLACLTLGALFAGCSTSTSPRGKAIAEGCVINTDCNDPLVCAFKRCHTECETSRDCPEGARCVASDRPFHVCQLEDERECTTNIDCPVGMICGVDGECRDACITARDCVAGQTCVSRACADPVELVNGELPPDPTAPADASTSRPCLRNTDCAAPLVCLEGSCSLECREDRDCAAGDSCRDERCTRPATVAPPPPTDGGAPECRYNSQCPGAEICRAGRCEAACLVDRDCSGGGTCSSGVCIAPPPAAGAGGRAGTGDAGPVGAGGGTSDAGGGCSYNSDCPVGQLCAGGACRCECRGDRDCSRGEACDGCGCQPVRPDGAPTNYGTPCGLSSDCLWPLVCRAQQCVYECNLTTDCSGSGFCCYDHQCVSGSVCEGAADGGGAGGGDACVACTSNFSCDDGLWCNGQELCWAGCCSPARDTPCSSHSSCVLDLCDEQTHLCRSEPQAAEDADKDGHLDIGCGGDDCDDHDRTTYLGAPELCDNRDNDCDGQRDEGSRAPFGPLITYTDGNGHHDAAVVPVDGGWIAFRGYAGATTVSLGVHGLAPDGTVLASSYGPGSLSGAGSGRVYGLQAASGGNRALVAYSTGGSHLASAWALDPAVDGGTPSVRMIRIVPLDSSGSMGYGRVDLAWTGVDFVAGYADATAQVGHVVHLDSEGNLGAGTAVPTPNGTGITGGRVHVGVWGGTVAALYTQANPVTAPLVTIFDSTGGLVVGPITLPAAAGASVLAIAGTANGYVAAWTDTTNGTNTTVVGIDGTLGATRPVPGAAGVIDGDAITDGPIGVFALWNSTTALIGSTDGVGPMPLVNALTGLHTTPLVTLGGYGGRYSVSSGSASSYQSKPVGCRPAE